MTDPMPHRRDILARAAALLGGAVSASAAGALLAGCVATPGAEAPAVPAGSPEAARRANLSRMADLILPRTDTPGALDVGVPAFIEKVMGAHYPQAERDHFHAGLDRVEADARATLGRGFSALSAGEQTAMMERYDREAYAQARSGASGPPHFFRTLKELTTLGFFSSEIGATQVLIYDHVPGALRACAPLSEIGRAWAV